jgi:hypothetical protein
MSDTPRTSPAPEEINIVLEKLGLSEEQLAQSIRWLLIKEAMRRQPKTHCANTFSFSDQPDFFIVEEVRKG